MVTKLLDAVRERARRYAKEKAYRFGTMTPRGVIEIAWLAGYNAALEDVKKHYGVSDGH